MGRIFYSRHRRLYITGIIAYKTKAAQLKVETRPHDSPVSFRAPRKMLQMASANVYAGLSIGN
jgi:hypothetical protein